MEWIVWIEPFFFPCFYFKSINQGGNEYHKLVAVFAFSGLFSGTKWLLKLNAVELKQPAGWVFSYLELVVKAVYQFENFFDA